MDDWEIHLQKKLREKTTSDIAFEKINDPVEEVEKEQFLEQLLDDKNHKAQKRAILKKENTSILKLDPFTKDIISPQKLITASKYS